MQYFKKHIKTVNSSETLDIDRQILGHAMWRNKFRNLMTAGKCDMKMANKRQRYTVNASLA